MKSSNKSLYLTFLLRVHMDVFCVDAGNHFLQAAE